jgi:hypothetical protein
VVDRDPAFDQQFLYIAVRQREAQVSTHCQHDHLGWEAEAGEGGPNDGSRAETAVLIAAVWLLRHRHGQRNSAPRVRERAGRLGRMGPPPAPSSNLRPSS